jgi:hypothetical protein
MYALSHLFGVGYTNGLKLEDKYLDLVETNELGSTSDSWLAEDLVPEETATKIMNNWIRENGKLQYTKDGGKTTISLKEHFIGQREKAATIGRKTGNLKDANNPTKLIQERFDAGCWQHGKPAYDNVACMAQITNTDLWSVSKEDVFKISPYVAFSVVKSLGFKGILDTTTGLMKVQDVSAWWNSLDDFKKKALVYKHWKTPKSLTDHEAAIAKEGVPNRLSHFGNKAFLEHVVGYMNANPDIINVQKESKLNNVDVHTGRPLQLQMAYNTKLADISSDLRFNLDNYSSSLLASLDRYGTVVGVAPMFMTGGQRVDMSGGSVIASPPRFANKLRSIYKAYVNRLASYKKKLTPETDKSITDLIDKLEEKEVQLRKILQHFRAYQIVVTTSGDKTPEYISVDKMKSALQEFGAKYGKYRRRVIATGDILNALNVAAMDNSGVNLPNALLET